MTTTGKCHEGIIAGKVGQEMGLKRLTDRIYYLEHESETDRPMLAYIRGDKWSLAIDAGYSSSHVADFYRAIEAEHLKKAGFYCDHPLAL